MSRFALLLCLLFCGCVRVPDVPTPPEPTANTEMDRYFESFRTNIGNALGKTADQIDGLDEKGYRDLLAANLLDAVTNSHTELSTADAALSNSGYTPEKAKELLRRRQREALRGQ